MLPLKNKLLLSTLLLCVTTSVYAERADRDKPIHLDADQVLIDDAKQISTFIGNVQFTQGTMVIRGDKIVVVEDKDGNKVGTAYGNTASFRQKREGLDEYVEGYGESIVYNTLAETVDFYVRARVIRELDDVRGEHITYSQKTEVFQVNSGAQGKANALPKRVHAVLQPKNKDANKAAEKMPPTKTDTLPIKSSDTLTPTE